MSYASVAQLRQYLSQLEAGAEVDALLQAVLDRAEDIIDDELTFSFAPWGEATAKDVQASGNPGGWLELPAHEQGSVTAVYEISGRGLESETMDEITEFVEEQDGRLYYHSGWTPNAWYRVTAIWGYGPAPDAIIEVELEVAINLWMGKDARNLGATVGVEGGGATPVNRALSWPQRDAIAGVRRRYLGLVFG